MDVAPLFHIDPIQDVFLSQPEAKPFSALPIRPEVLSVIESLNYSSMTSIQAQSLPVILNRQDVLAQANTGTGKTAAFVIGILNTLDSQLAQTQALILCPTRELADQVTNECRRLARSIPNTRIVMLCGGKPLQPQLVSLQHVPHIVTGTPGRILKHLGKGSLDLKQISMLVLDEADRMLDMGFYDDIAQIIKQTPVSRQTLLFSATYPEEITRVSRAVQNQPETIRVNQVHAIEQIEQCVYRVKAADKTTLLVNLLRHHKPASCIVFCNQKIDCQSLADDLVNRGFHALALHGDMEQFDRDRALVLFANNSCSILVATEVAARGLDIKALEVVFNYDLSFEPEMHVHRIGRTGRAGEKGLAISLALHSEQFRLDAIEEYQGSAIPVAQSSAIKGGGRRPGEPPMVTLFISAGRKNKVRPTDILGALTSSEEISGQQIGKITIFDTVAYVAVERTIAALAHQVLSTGTIKGRKFKVKSLR